MAEEVKNDGAAEKIVDAPELKTPEPAPKTGSTDGTADPGAKAPELPPLPEKPVKITVSRDGSESVMTELELHIPTMIKAVSEAADDATVKIEIAQIGMKGGTVELKPGERPALEIQWKTAFEGKKADALAQLEHSNISAENIPREFYKFAQYVIDHSDLQAVSVCIACKDKDGKDAVAGFVQTAKHCTNASAAVLVECMDANTNEFIAKANLTIPGRNAPKMGDLVIPTAADKEKLGL